MLKGIFIGVMVSAVILFSSCLILGYGSDMCNPGIGFLLSPLILISAVIASLFLIKSSSQVIAAAAKTVLLITGLGLTVCLFLFFR
jgi:hypothetical protein